MGISNLTEQEFEIKQFEKVEIYILNKKYYLIGNLLKKSWKKEVHAKKNTM